MSNIGLSVVTLWPYCLGKTGFKRAISMAKSAGFNGVQALPIKGWVYGNSTLKNSDVLSYEDAFMYGSFMQAIKRSLGLEGEPSPTLIDWLLFGRKMSPVFPNALYVCHDLSCRRNALLEISPEFSVDPDYYLSLCHSGKQLCWDTYHIRRQLRSGSPGIPDWRVLLNKLPSGSLALIHLHLIKEEIGPFMRGTATPSVEMLRALKIRFPNVPVIVEMLPPLKGPVATLQILTRVLNVTREILW